MKQEFSEQAPSPVGAALSLGTNAGGHPLASAFLSRWARARPPRPDWVTPSPICDSPSQYAVFGHGRRLGTCSKVTGVIPEYGFRKLRHRSFVTWSAARSIFILHVCEPRPVAGRHFSGGTCLRSFNDHEPAPSG